MAGKWVLHLGVYRRTAYHGQVGVGSGLADCKGSATEEDRDFVHSRQHSVDMAALNILDWERIRIAMEEAGSKGPRMIRGVGLKYTLTPTKGQPGGAPREWKMKHSFLERC